MRTSVVILLMFAGCASGRDPAASDRVMVASGFDRETMELIYEKTVHGTEYAVPSRKVYEAMLGAYEALKIPLQSSRPHEGVAVFRLQTNRLRIAGRRASEFIDCGIGPAGPRADSYRVTLAATSVVERIDDGRTRLRTVVEASARDSGVSSTELRCVTTGLLEKEIASNVSVRVSR